jgi:AcrR family transcriptional regulator
MLVIEEKTDRRIKRTRNLILDSFQELLSEKMFENISVQDVTERADINRGTFYAHFEDKYALLDYWIGQLVRQEIEKRTLNCDYYSHENLRSLIRMVCELLSCTRRDCLQPQPQFESLVEGPFKKQVFELISHWLTQSSSEIPVEIPATVATWAIYGLAAHYTHGKNRPDLEKFVDEALPFVAVNLDRFA